MRSSIWPRRLHISSRVVAPGPCPQPWPAIRKKDHQVENQATPVLQNTLQCRREESCLPSPSPKPMVKEKNPSKVMQEGIRSPRLPVRCWCQHPLPEQELQRNPFSSPRAYTASAGSHIPHQLPSTPLFAPLRILEPASPVPAEDIIQEITINKLRFPTSSAMQ